MNYPTIETIYTESFPKIRNSDTNIEKKLSLFKIFFSVFSKKPLPITFK